MSDYCKDCLLELFGMDTKDLANLCTPEDNAKGLYPVVLCEGCGPIQVDHAGNCISQDCEGTHRGGKHAIRQSERDKA